jgi:hypothetical protein
MPAQQAHNHFGAYANAASLPNSTAEPDLKAGDLAFAISEAQTYTCTDPVTPTWVSAGGSGVSQWNQTQTIHVAKHGNNSNDGSAINLAKLTIGSALTQAASLSPSSSNPVVVLIHPGVYSEAVNTQSDWVSLVGVDKKTCIVVSSTTNTLIVDQSNLTISNLTFDMSGGNVALNVVGTRVGVQFVNCRFENSDNNNAAQLAQSGAVYYHECEFICANTARTAIGTSGSLRGPSIFYECKAIGQITSSGQNYEWYGGEMTSTFSTATIRYGSGTGAQYGLFKGAKILNERTGGGGRCVILDGAIETYFIDCDFDGSSTTSAEEISSYGQDIYVKNCRFQKGMNSGVRNNAGPYYLGSPGQTDIYVDLDAAFQAVAGNQSDKTILLKDNIEIDSGNVATPGSGVRAVLDGRGFTISSSSSSAHGVICGQGSSVVCLHNIKFVDVAVNGLDPAAIVRIRDCDFVGGQIRNTSGEASTVIILDRVSMKSPTTDAGAASGCIVASSFTTTFRIYRSFLKGNTGVAAIAFNATHNSINGLSIAYSVLVHGDGGANVPIDDPGVATNCDSHHNAYNADPFTSNLSNTITTPQDVVDTNIDYDFGV